MRIITFVILKLSVQKQQKDERHDAKNGSKLKIEYNLSTYEECVLMKFKLLLLCR